MMYSKIELNEMLKSNGFEEFTSEELAYQLTAYEKGYIDYEDGIKDLYVKPYLDDLFTSDLIEQYNEYCRENQYYDDIIEPFNEEFFENNFSSPYEAARATFFGNISNWACEYIRFNGGGNLESLWEHDAQREILADSTFINWVYENNSDFEVFHDEDFKADIVGMTIQLVRQGY